MNGSTLDLLCVLEDVLSIIKNDGETNYGETPEDESYIVFESAIIYAVESDIKDAIAQSKGESK